MHDWIVNSWLLKQLIESIGWNSLTMILPSIVLYVIVIFLTASSFHRRRARTAAPPHRILRSILYCLIDCCRTRINDQ